MYNHALNIVVNMNFVLDNCLEKYIHNKFRFTTRE